MLLVARTPHGTADAPSSRDRWTSLSGPLQCRPGDRASIATAGRADLVRFGVIRALLAQPGIVIHDRPD